MDDVKTKIILRPLMQKIGGEALDAKAVELKGKNS